MKAILGVALLAVCACAQTYQTMPIKNTQVFNPLLTTEWSGLKVNNGEWTILSLQELIQHPLFQVYYQIPIFKQHFNHPLFQAYLVTPQFQNYWTHPLFPTFFNNQVLFYKYIYPQVFNTNVQYPQVFNTNVQTPFWMNKMIQNTQVVPTNYDQIIRKVLGQNVMQKDLSVEGLWWDKIMKTAFVNVNKPEEVTEVKTEVKIPITATQTMFNPIDKILSEKMIEESPVEIVMKDALVKDTIVKEDIMKNALLKKIYLEKFNKMNLNKMTPEEFTLLQNKMEELLVTPSRIRRSANFVQIPSVSNYAQYNKVLPFNYNIPSTQGVYYTQPQVTFPNTVGTPYTYTNTVGTPYTYTNTVGTPYTYTNTVGTPFTNTVGTPYTYTNTVGTPFTNTVGNINTPYFYPTQPIV